MAMLAEPRRRQKLSFDPRNKAWSDDSSKFGQKLMEKMGWSEGKGLGLNEDGNLSHVKVSLKNNNLGIGCKASQEDNWIAHQDDFNDLLTTLGESHSTSSLVEAEEEARSLEERSKKTKSRVRYHKFVRGKDLSKYGKDGVKSILGRRKTHSAPVTPQSNSVEHSEDENEQVAEGDQSGVSHGVVTIKSSCSVQEYFAQKMSSLRNSQTRLESESHSDTELQAPRAGFGFSPGLGLGPGNGAGLSKQDARKKGIGKSSWVVGSSDSDSEKESGKDISGEHSPSTSNMKTPASGMTSMDQPGTSGVRPTAGRVSLGEAFIGSDGNEGEAEPDGDSEEAVCLRGDSEEALGVHGDRTRAKKKKKKRKKKKGRNVSRDSDEEVPEALDEGIPEAIEVRGESENEEDEGIDMGRKKKKNKKKKRLMDEVVVESRSDSASEHNAMESGERKKKKKTKKSKKDKSRREEEDLVMHSCSHEDDDAADTSEGRSGSETSKKRKKESSEVGLNDEGRDTSSGKKRKRNRLGLGEVDSKDGGECSSKY